MWTKIIAMVRKRQLQRNLALLVNMLKEDMPNV